MYVPGVICKNHGPFVLEKVAEMDILTKMVDPAVERAPQCIQDKHFMRKHGPNAYYGQGDH